MKVRIARPEDAGSVAAIYAPFVTATIVSFEESPPSGAEMAQRIAATLRSHPFLVAQEAEQILGYAYAAPHAARQAYRWSANVSAYMAPGARRRGIGRALYGRLFSLLERQGFHALFAGIALPNAPSVAFHEAMGFAHLGTFREVGFKLGAWRDVGYWRLGLAAGPAPAEPVPFSALEP